MIVVEIRRAKNLKRGATFEKVIPRFPGDPLCPCAALDRWLEVRPKQSARAFTTLSIVSIRDGQELGGRPLRGEDIARRVEKYARAANHEGFFRGHALRVGFVTEAKTRAGADATDIAAVTGQTVATVYNYVRTLRAYEQHPLHLIYAQPTLLEKSEE